MARSRSNSRDRSRKRKGKKKSRSRSRSQSPGYRKEKRTKSKQPKRSKHSRSRSVSSTRRGRSRERSRSGSRRRGSPRKHRRSREHRSRSPRERFSRSNSRGHYSGSPHRRSRSASDNSDSRGRPRDKKPVDKDLAKSAKSTTNEPFPELTPQEQLKLRVKMSLESAVAADEKLKPKVKPFDVVSSDELFRTQQAIADIESDSFHQTVFTSSKSNPKTKSEITFGTTKELILGPAEPTKVIATESFAHPNLKKDFEKSMTKWIAKLTSIRQRLLKT